MSNVTPPYSDAGKASFEQLDTYLQTSLIAGDQPELASYPFVIAASQTLKLGHVVGLDGSGHIVPATAPGEGAITPIGVMTQAVTTGSGETTTSAPVWYSGCFNIRGLTWDASFTTDALKFAAFQGAPTPTTITIKKRQSDQ